MHALCKVDVREILKNYISAIKDAILISLLFLNFIKYNCFLLIQTLVTEKRKRINEVNAVAFVLSIIYWVDAKVSADF